METIIGGNIYQHSKVPQWTNTTVEHILGQLTKMNKPFKYIGKEDSKYPSRTLRSRTLFSFHSSRTFFPFLGYLSNVSLCRSSHVRHHGKERRRPPHCDVVLLGQHNRWWVRGTVVAVASTSDICSCARLRLSELGPLPLVKENNLSFIGFCRHSVSAFSTSLDFPRCSPE
ncbi:unnamed protein product [Ixodes pacificus]